MLVKYPIHCFIQTLNSLNNLISVCELLMSSDFISFLFDFGFHAVIAVKNTLSAFIKQVYLTNTYLSLNLNKLEIRNISKRFLNDRLYFDYESF